MSLFLDNKMRRVRRSLATLAKIKRKDFRTATTTPPLLNKPSEYKTRRLISTSHRGLYAPSVIENNENLSLKVSWDNGEESEFANIFLRDQCQCPSCFKVESYNRLLEPYTIPSDVKPKNIEITQNSINISWTDEHFSSYPFEYLQNIQKGLDDDVRYLEPIMWKSGYFKKNGFPTYDLSDLIENESAMLDWFLDLKRLGVTLLKGGEEKKGALELIKEKLFGGYFKSTHYGHTFEVISKQNAGNLAYTSQGLWPHVDLPHIQEMPGIQALHCIVQTQSHGGESTLVDGFQAAQQLKDMDPHLFDFLTKYKVRYRDIGSDYFGQFETFCERPIIDFSGDRYHGIYHINFQRDYANRGSVEEVKTFYKALRQFTGLLIHPENIFQFKLKPGDVIVFDNQRVLHGRTAFDASPVTLIENEVEEQNEEKITRHLQGCYFDWDQIFWRIRPVKRRVEAERRKPVQ
ncbi:gamma-butyrobetaine dioxygenase-like [Clytia hemisphaerica]|uniref:gamma-butyrobetaine dioxygenase-like n=1 Tax=Clytia hemisphaerica TaxID=252671 RepID=UPI0034D3C06B